MRVLMIERECQMSGNVICAYFAFFVSFFQYSSLFCVSS